MHNPMASLLETKAGAHRAGLNLIYKALTMKHDSLLFAVLN